MQVKERGVIGRERERKRIIIRASAKQPSAPVETDDQKREDRRNEREIGGRSAGRFLFIEVFV